MKLDWSLVYWRRTPNHSNKTDGNVKHTGIGQTARKTRTSRKSEKQETRNEQCIWSIRSTHRTIIADPSCSRGIPKYSSFRGKMCNLSNKISGVERQPMMQTNKILYRVSKRSSSRKPDSLAKTTRNACDRAKWYLLHPELARKK